MPYILNAALTGLFLVLCITASVSAQPISLPLDVKRHELRNGLHILTLENHTLPIISYYTFFRVGSRHESIGQVIHTYRSTLTSVRGHSGFRRLPLHR